MKERILWAKAIWENRQLCLCQRLHGVIVVLIGFYDEKRSYLDGDWQEVGFRNIEPFRGEYNGETWDTCAIQGFHWIIYSDSSV